MKNVCVTTKITKKIENLNRNILQYTVVLSQLPVTYNPNKPLNPNTTNGARYPLNPTNTLETPLPLQARTPLIKHTFIHSSVWPPPYYFFGFEVVTEPSEGLREEEERGRGEERGEKEERGGEGKVGEEGGQERRKDFKAY